MIKLWWSRTPLLGNLGDVLTPVLLHALGYRFEWVPVRMAQLIGIGSTIKFAQPRHTIWGSGAARRSDKPDRAARYLAVRGPLTREIVLRNGGSCPEVYGDPALLLPRFHNKPVEQQHSVGIVPHYVDYGEMRKRYAGITSVRVISTIHKNPLDVVDEIRSCRRIVSSSLHGIVVAHAYGIPAAWVKWSERLDGDDTKFYDHGLAVGAELVPVKPSHTLDAEVSTGTLDTEPLIQVLHDAYSRELLHSE